MTEETRILYKLTTQDNRTRVGEFNETLWGANICHKPEQGGEPVLCSATVIHAYEHPLIAAFMNPQHAALSNPKLWMCVGTPVVFDWDLKCGCTSLTTCQEIPSPVITTEQYARIAKSAAEYAEYAAKSVECAECAAEYAAKSAKYAAEYAKCAAEYAEYAAEYAEYAAKSAKCAAEYAAKSAAKYAAEYAAKSAKSAKSAAKPFSLLEIILKVIPEYKGAK